MKLDTIITGGRIVTENNSFDCDLGIIDEQIACIGDAENMSHAKKEIDASGKLVMPGVVDPHVHIDNATSIETWSSGSKAAAAGGVTSILSFAWQGWNGEKCSWDKDRTLIQAVEQEKDRALSSIIDYGFHATITREDPAVLTDLPEIIDRGVPSIKVFTAYEFGLSYGFLYRVFEQLAALNGIVTVHTEDKSVCSTFLKQWKEQNRGDPDQYPSSRPPFTEAMAVDNALRLATETGVNYYGMHTSCEEAADVFARFQQNNRNIKGETCPQYLLLEDSAYDTQDCLPIIAPPLRKSKDNEALFQALQNSVLEVISTDHVAFKKDSKITDDWWDSKFGANCIQNSLSLVHDEAINKRGYSYPFLVKTMCTNPAEIFGLKNKGTLEPGTDADIVIFDPNKLNTIISDDNYSQADYSIFENKEVVGEVSQTLVRGTTVYADGEIVSPDHRGKFMQRTQPSWN